MNKSQLWRAIKNAGNPNNFTWRTKIADMRSFYQDFQHQQHVKTHQVVAVLSKTADSKQEDIKSAIDTLREKLNDLPAGKIIKLSNGKEFMTGSVAGNKLANRIF